MTAALDLLAWSRVQRRAEALAPDLRAALFKAWEAVRATLSDAEVTRLIGSGRLDLLLAQVLDEATLDQAFTPFRLSVAAGVERAGLVVHADLPRVAQLPVVAFDRLNPKVIDAIRGLNTTATQTLKADVRETVRQAVQRGIEAGQGPRTVARQVREAVGLAPNQEAYIANLRAELEQGRYADARQRKMLDKRFNLSNLDVLPAEERARRIDTIVRAYRDRAIALNAETNTRTLALEAQKLGARLTWQDAIDRGAVDPARLMKRWSGVMDSRERPTHVAMEGEVVPFGEPYSNGQMDPGDTEYNCRCISIVFQSRAAIPRGSSEETILAGLRSLAGRA